MKIEIFVTDNQVRLVLPKNAPENAEVVIKCNKPIIIDGPITFPTPAPKSTKKIKY